MVNEPLADVRGHEPVFSRAVAAQLAEVSVAFLRACEEQELVRVRTMQAGGYGYAVGDIQRLYSVRRLCLEIGHDSPSSDVPSRMLFWAVDVLMDAEETKRQALARERELMTRIERLERRLLELGAGW